ncbi:hypothetical protein LMG28614_00199 [Paraburkholderia ultramafica]|uniref:Uncharacterized protein n=1 Tax=Paraburkholderia ultramafica TaxID=1544867 RepID=A0A6S7B2V6_9BURK|nr:hypothetical protein LMG28614_00199 [Paraburkholderia ultramafica]
MENPGRRRALQTLTALAAATLPAAHAKTAPSAQGAPAAPLSGGRRITELIGTNGWAGSASDLEMWHEMGITWGRDAVGPGQLNVRSDSMLVNKTGVAYDMDLPPVVIRNNRNGIGSLLLLAYTPSWNASLPGDSKSAPVNVDVWKRYVDAVVRKYSAPPYNLRYFQIWNEAAGRLSGGAPQASFWHGPGFNSADEKHSQPYQRAMQDYVERIHIPAARIIRRYHAYVVYGGWPDQGGLDTYTRWLEWRSPAFNARMLDWVDYLDTHYLNVADLDPLYQQYVKNGPARGIWQTEIGDTYMNDPHYLPRYFFDFAVWALDRNWDDPDKYVSMVYHWDGYEPFRLTHRGPPERTYNVPGESLIVLRQTVFGSLGSFSRPLQFGPGATGSALRSDNDIVFQVNADPGWRTVSATGVPPPSSGKAQVMFIDALTGFVSPREEATVSWNEQTMSVRFKVPSRVNGQNSKPPGHLAYVVVRPQA